MKIYVSSFKSKARILFYILLVVALLRIIEIPKKNALPGDYVLLFFILPTTYIIKQASYSNIHYFHAALYSFIFACNFALIDEVTKKPLLG
jgi:hypothetical protein